MYEREKLRWWTASPSFSNNAMDDETDDLPEDVETLRLMQEHDIDADKAEKVQELIDEGLDEDDAVELADEL